jgi:hypothetical protein
MYTYPAMRAIAVTLTIFVPQNGPKNRRRQQKGRTGLLRVPRALFARRKAHHE